MDIYLSDAHRVSRTAQMLGDGGQSGLPGVGWALLSATVLPNDYAANLSPRI